MTSSARERIEGGTVVALRPAVFHNQVFFPRPSGLAHSLERGPKRIGLRRCATDDLDCYVRLCVLVLRAEHGKAPFASHLQLAFDLVQEAPVCAIGDDLLRTAFDHAQLMHPQRIEAHRVFGIVFPPPVVRQLANHL